MLSRLCCVAIYCKYVGLVLGQSKGCKQVVNEDSVGFRFRERFRIVPTAHGFLLCMIKGSDLAVER